MQLILLQIGDTFVICDAGGGTVVLFPELLDHLWLLTRFRILLPTLSWN